MGKVSDGRRGDVDIPEPDSSESVATGTIDQRRTGRARVQIQFFVQGDASGEDAGFFEEARTIEINVHGALLSMKTAVTPGQRLTLTNSTNRRTQECTVTAVSAKAGGDVEAAVAFSAPAPKFWRPRRHPQLSAFSLLD